MVESYTNDYDNFLDIDDSDVFIRKYSDENIAVYNKRLSPSPDLISQNIKPHTPNIYHTHTPVVFPYSNVKILYLLFIMTIIWVIIYLFSTINIVVK